MQCSNSIVCKYKRLLVSWPMQLLYSHHTHQEMENILLKMVVVVGNCIPIGEWQCEFSSSIVWHQKDFLASHKYKHLRVEVRIAFHHSSSASSLQNTTHNCACFFSTPRNKRLSLEMLVKQQYANISLSIYAQQLHTIHLTISLVFWGIVVNARCSVSMLGFHKQLLLISSYLDWQYYIAAALLLPIIRLVLHFKRTTDHDAQAYVSSTRSISSVEHRKQSS